MQFVNYFYWPEYELLALLADLIIYATHKSEEIITQRKGNIFLLSRVLINNTKKLY